MVGKEIYIFGAAGFAAESALIARQCGYHVAAFVESDAAWMPERTALELMPGDWVKIMPQSQFADSIVPGTCVAIAIADATIARRIADQFASVLSFPNIIHPSASVEAASIENCGNIIYPGCIISWHAHVGRFNKFQAYVTIGHEVKIGDFNEFNPRATVSGCVTVGNGCLLGAACSVRQGLRIGDDAVVGMGAVVTNDVSDGDVVAGVPARSLK